MARQPILDRQGAVHAFELLYRRAGEIAGSLGLEEEYRSILNAVVEVGLGRLVGDKPAFFNLSPEMLFRDCVCLLPPERVVLELLENTVYDDATAVRIAELRGHGYRLAYDDFTFQPHQLAFVGRVDLIKVDVMDAPWALVERGVPRLKAAGACLLAEKVEDRETYERCLRAGFDLFQGYYFSHPETVRGRGAEPRTRAVLKLLSVLNRPDATVAQLEAAVAGDASLAARLLKLVNSAGFGIGRPIGSIRVAVQMLGLQRLQSFATLIAASGATGADNRVLADLGLIRARMCERVARDLGDDQPHRQFTIGLLSVLDALMDLPMGEIVAELALPEEVGAALLDPARSEALSVVFAYERGGWGVLQRYAVDAESLAAVYAEAVADTAILD